MNLKIASVLALSLLAFGCEDEKSAEPKQLAPTATALATSKSESKKAVRYAIAEDGKADFMMEGKIETIKGSVGKSKGSFEVDLGDLTQTRGQVEMDLSTLETHTFGDAERDKKQTIDARTWLEVGEKIEDAQKRQANQWAVFAIRSIESAEPKDLSKGGAQRAARITAKGDLLVHGRKSERTVNLDVTFTFEGDQAKKLQIKTSKPIDLNLEAHEIRPRDSVGKFVGWAGKAVLRDKVSEEAKISIAMTATPGG